MAEIKNVLFPTDFSGPSERAYLVADPIVAHFGAKLHLLHLISWHGSSFFSRSEYGLPPSEQSRILSKMEKEAREKLDETFGISPDYYVQMVSESTPSISDGIARYSAEHDIDLIVMGTSSDHQGFRHLFGGTVERVLRATAVPVLAVGGQSATPVDVDCVMVPVDLSVHSASLLQQADWMCNALGARMVVLHVVSPTGSVVPQFGVATGVSTVVTTSLDEIHQSVQNLVDDHVQLVDQVEIRIVEGEPDAAIVQSSEADVDLIVIASHGQRGAKRFFVGSTALHAVHHASCPVLMVKSDGDWSEDEAEVEL